jgi:hypothetical protein
MSRAFRLLLASAATLVAVVSGCGGQPTQGSAISVAAAPAPEAAPSEAATPAPTAPAPEAGPPAAATPVAPAAADTAAAPAGEERVEHKAMAQSAKKVSGGYRLVKRDGKELYCRSITMIGSRFPEQMCFTREQIKEIEERTDHAMDDFEQARKTCTGGEYCIEF